MIRKCSVFLLMLVISLAYSVPVMASIKIGKAYKEAFPDEKPKCSCCHVDEKPKKDDGKHDLNAYGKKAAAIKAEIDAESFKQAGSNACAKE